MARIITLGSLNLDFTYQLPKPLETGETLSSLSYRCGAGGKGANQSIAAARAGAEVFHAGRIGHDGGLLRRTLEEAGVRLDFLEERVSAIRDAIGYEVPLAIDHIGHVGFENVISLARRLEKYSLSWFEDPVPWFYTDQLALISQATTIPVCTGEDIYLRDNFMPLLEKRAVSVIHPDVLTVGGMNELMHTLDEAERHGVAACLHMAETPVGCMASAHVATAAGKNFVALEFHSFDVPWWEEIVKGGKGKIIKDGHIAVPDRPGLGIDELVLDAKRIRIRRHERALFQKIEILQHSPLQRIFDGQHAGVRLAAHRRGVCRMKIRVRDVLRLRAEPTASELRIASLRAEITDLHVTPSPRWRK